MLIKETLYGLNDVTIIPEKMTSILSRVECDPYINTPLNNIVAQNWSYVMLPIFAAPMSSVVNENNIRTYITNGISPVVPRNVDYEKRRDMMTKVMCAFSLDEFNSFVNEYRKKVEGGYKIVNKYFVCVDLANGHMEVIYNLCKNAKHIFGNNIVIMTGNIANPETYLEIARFGCIDYIRVGIGNGNVCTTSANTAIHYPMASLISKCREYKNNAYQYGDTFKFPEIVADGGFKNYDQVIKALALGADYVMLGEIFARAEESSAKTTYKFNFKNLLKFKNPFDKYHVYYGMSTRKAQKEFGKAGNKTAEGIVKYVPVQYTVKGWVDNFKSYLKSAMSYTNSRKLNEFIGEVEIRLMSNNAFASYYK